MNITGSFQIGTYPLRTTQQTGAFYGFQLGSSDHHGQDWDGNTLVKTGFDASRSWTGETSSNGSHSHTVTIVNTGSGQAFSILPPYIKKAWFMKVAE
jgi:hypothetical protein